MERIKFAIIFNILFSFNVINNVFASGQRTLHNANDLLTINTNALLTKIKNEQKTDNPFQHFFNIIKKGEFLPWFAETGRDSDFPYELLMFGLERSEEFTKLKSTINSDYIFFRELYNCTVKRNIDSNIILGLFKIILFILALE